jgi:hypothetical protein
VTCGVDNSGTFDCSDGSTPIYCPGSDNPVGDGLSPECGQPSPDPSGVGEDYCCE